MRLERRDWRGPLWGRTWRLRWPVSGGCPRRMFGSALRWGRGWRSQRRAAAWLGARGPLCPQWGWRGWCSQCCPQGLGLVHPVLQTMMPERGQPYPDTLFRRRSNNLFRRRSADVPVAPSPQQQIIKFLKSKEQKGHRGERGEQGRQGHTNPTH